MEKIYSAGKVYCPTNTRIEYTLKNRGRELGINFSKLFEKALREEVERLEALEAERGDRR